MPLTLLLSVLLGYLVGSVPTGALVARAWGGPDLTQVGSGRTGATNVLRTLGKKAAALVFLGDLLKGVLAVLIIARLLPGADAWDVAAAGMAAVVGHCYSPFMGFKGGRGVATALGGALALAPPAAALGLLCGIAAVATTRLVSLGSIVGTLAAALTLLVLVATNREPPAYGLYALAVAAFIVVAHHDNIARLRSGTERRLGERA